MQTSNINVTRGSRIKSTKYNKLGVFIQKSCIGFDNYIVDWGDGYRYVKSSDFKLAESN